MLMKIIAVLALLSLFFTGLIADDPKYEGLTQDDKVQMANLIQASSVYRFGDDLKKGDYNQYFDYEDSVNIIIKVVEETPKELIIEEKNVEDNVCFLITIQKSTKEVVNITYKVDDIIETIPLLSKNELAKMDKDIQGYFQTQKKKNKESHWRVSANQTVIPVNVEQLSCNYLEMQFDTIPMLNSQNNSKELKENSRIYYSNKVKKMLPLPYLIDALYTSDLKAIKGGLVQYPKCKLISYSK